MSETAILLNVDAERIVPALKEATSSLDGAQGEVILNFSSVYRIDSAGLRALEELGRVAREKDVRVALRGVNVDVYKVFKLVKLTQNFSFVE